jgi:hypothetical protein
VVIVGRSLAEEVRGSDGMVRVRRPTRVSEQRRGWCSCVGPRRWWVSPGTESCSIEDFPSLENAQPHDVLGSAWRLRRKKSRSVAFPVRAIAAS